MKKGLKEVLQLINGMLIYMVIYVIYININVEALYEGSISSAALLSPPVRGGLYPLLRVPPQAPYTFG